jgi:hypothetical protein
METVAGGEKDIIMVFLLLGFWFISMYLMDKMDK